MKNIKALGINLGKNCVGLITHIMYFCLAIIGMYMWAAPFIENAPAVLNTILSITNVILAASVLILVPFVILAFIYENDKHDMAGNYSLVFFIASIGLNMFLGRRLYLTDPSNYQVFGFFDKPIVIYAMTLVCFITAICSIVEMYIMLIQGIKDVKTQND